MKVTVIGIGGIGTNLINALTRYLASITTSPGEHTLDLVDGDSFEPHNRSRQVFGTPGKKAQVVFEELVRQFPEVRLRPRAEYVSPKNIEVILEEDAIVFLCVDNHATRLLVSNACGKLDNVSLISGGNELTDGNIQVYLRRAGQDATPSLVVGHPEIAAGKDRAPYEMSCEEQAQAGAPQLLFANLMAASLMVNAFYRITTDEAGFLYEKPLPGTDAGHLAPDTRYHEVFFDINRNAARARRSMAEPCLAPSASQPVTAQEIRS